MLPPRDTPEGRIARYALAQIEEARAMIDRAERMLILVQRGDREPARHPSRRTNQKLHGFSG